MREGGREGRKGEGVRERREGGGGEKGREGVEGGRSGGGRKGGREGGRERQEEGGRRGGGGWEGVMLVGVPHCRWNWKLENPEYSMWVAMTTG